MWRFHFEGEIAMGVQSVRAKFRVNQVRDVLSGDDVVAKDIQMWPITGGSAENDAFFEATPSGEVTMRVKNPVAAEFFKQGQELYVDFTPAE